MMGDGSSGGWEQRLAVCRAKCCAKDGLSPTSATPARQTTRRRSCLSSLTLLNYELYATTRGFQTRQTNAITVQQYTIIPEVSCSTPMAPQLNTSFMIMAARVQLQAPRTPCSDAMLYLIAILTHVHVFHRHLSALNPWSSGAVCVNGRPTHQAPISSLYLAWPFWLFSVFFLNLRISCCTAWSRRRFSSGR
jgi:hypothetical protein